MIKNSIFIVSGMEAPFEIERLDFEGDEMLNQRVIEYTDKSMMPVLYEVPVDYCVWKAVIEITKNSFFTLFS